VAIDPLRQVSRASAAHTARCHHPGNARRLQLGDESIDHRRRRRRPRQHVTDVERRQQPLRLTQPGRRPARRASGELDVHGHQPVSDDRRRLSVQLVGARR
jgi:hypothetical protein